MEEPGQCERRSWWHTFFASLWQRIRNAPRRLWLMAIALLLILGIAALVTLSLRPPEPPVEDAEPIKTPPEPDAPDSLKRWWILRGEPLVPERPSAEPVEIQPKPRSLDGRDALVIGLSLMLFCVGLRWLLLPGMVERYRQAQAVRRHQRVTSERKRLAEQAEQRQAPLHLTYQVERYPPLPVSVAEDSAAILGRLFRSLSSADLDITATVHATIQQGGRLAPVYLSQSVAGQFLVLLDIERGDYPWLAGIHWLLERWAALGVRFARYDFRFDPLFVSMPATGNPVPLQRLARHADDEPLLIISRALSTQGLRERAAWLAELDAWPVKAWLDLVDPRPLGKRRRERREIRELEGLGLQRFPFSEAGLLALARYLAEGGQGIRTPTWEPLKPLSDPEVARALPRWALLAALVPDATWDQLDYLRRRFPDLNAALPTPRYLQRLLEWVAREDNNSNPESEDGRTLVLSEALVDKLIREQRQRDAELPAEQRLEAQGRRLLLEQLDATRPDDELLRQFWEVKRISHLLRLEPERALARLPLLLDGAAGAELLRAIEVELERQKELPLLEPGMQDQLALVTGHAAGRLHLGELLGRPWQGWLEPGLTMLVAVTVGFFVAEQWPGLKTWLLRPPTTIEVSGIMPAVREVELVESEFRDTLKDGSKGPEMVVIPAGEFMMGSPEDEGGRYDNERQHLVRIERPFAVGKYEVTFEEYDRFAEATGSKKPGDRGWGRGRRPVINVTWKDAKDYADWLSEQTGEAYRLPKEAEWEYAARAGTQTAYWWGNDIGSNNANCYNCGSRWDRKQTAPVGSFRANAFGLYDTAGNVWEWTCSVYDKNYGGAEQECYSKNRADYGVPRVLRGGSWVYNPRGVRAARRFGSGPALRFYDRGFHLARQF